MMSIDTANDGHINLVMPCTFLESSYIIQHRYAVGFMETSQSMPYRRLRRTVVSLIPLSANSRNLSYKLDY